MIRRPPRSTLDRSSAASDVYKRQPLIPQKISKIEMRGVEIRLEPDRFAIAGLRPAGIVAFPVERAQVRMQLLSLIHISEPTRPY